MHITTKNKQHNEDQFDWNTYFSDVASTYEISPSEALQIVQRIRSYSKESPGQIALTLTQMLRSLFKKINLPTSIQILELGAGTGTLTRWLLNEYQGSGVLLDNNSSSYDAFIKVNFELSEDLALTYERTDIFNYSSTQQFDIVCSFGLVEHFKEKKEIIELHAKFLKPGGYALILVPGDSFLSRMYWDVHPELNYGYRELMTQKEVANITNYSNLRLCEVITSKNYVYDIIAGLFKLED